MSDLMVQPQPLRQPWQIKSPWYTTLSSVLAPDHEHASWMRDAGSTTQRADRTGHSCDIRLIGQGWVDNGGDAMEGIHADQTSPAPCFVRQVVIYQCHRPWMVAQSEIPATMDTLIERLQNHPGVPLGRDLFEPGWSRRPLRFARLFLATAWQERCCDLQIDPAATWPVRRSQFERTEEGDALTLWEVAL